MSDAPAHHVAQFNWAILRDDWGTPAVAGFEDNLERLNLIAQRTGGLVWRMSMTRSRRRPSAWLAQLAKTRAPRSPCRCGTA